jgi:hypothetical protein
MVQQAMPLDVSLPDNPVVLQHMIRELLATLKDRDRELDGVRHRLDQLLRRLYGPRSERINPDQLSLFDEPSPSTDDAKADTNTSADEEADAAEPTARKKKKGAHGRKALPTNLKRERVVHDLSDAEKCCPCCQKPRVAIGEQTSEQLDYQPSSLFVWEHVRRTYACVDCLAKAERAVEPLPVGTTLESWLPANADQPGLIQTAAMPAQPIAKGLPGAGLLG